MLAARETKMLSAERMERMIDAPTNDEAAKILEECGYGDLSGLSAKEAGAALEAHIAALFDEVEGMVPEAQLVQLFRLKYDYHNAKALIKARAMGVECDAILSQRGTVAPQKLLTAFLEEDYRDIPPILALAAASILAAVVCFGGEGQPVRPLWIWSALLSGGLPLALPVAGTLPLSSLNRRLNRSGSAVAGYAGASAITAARRMVVTDDDLFPPGTVSLNGLKLYGEEIGKVVSYAATAAQAAGSQLTPLFDQLLASEGGTHLHLEDLRFYEDGGIGGTIRGESVTMGSAYFMKKHHVSLPRDLKLKTGVFLAVDGQLIAIFAIKYQPSRNVEWALRAMRRNRITPVLATRSANITPALLKRKFRLDARPLYPDISTRLALSELTEGRGRPHAIIYRDGLMAFAETVIGSRRMRRAVRDGTVLSWLGGLSGLLLAYYFTSVGAFAALSALNFLCFLLLWLLTVLLLAGLVRHY